MSGLFTIPISGLKEGRHNLNFEINKGFFEQFEESEVKNGMLEVFVEADKRSSHINLAIRIRGVVSISCDRCLLVFSHPVDCENRLLIEFGKINDESDPDIITVPADEFEHDLKQYFYEYIILALPIQRIHPVDKNGISGCDPEMLKKLNQHIINEDNGIDPRWNELKKLINNN
jgi:uncharacterized metal-binding protein YceD (DUF177 family)